MCSLSPNLALLGHFNNNNNNNKLIMQFRSFPFVNENTNVVNKLLNKVPQWHLRYAFYSQEQEIDCCATHFQGPFVRACGSYCSPQQHRHVAHTETDPAVTDIMGV